MQSETKTLDGEGNFRWRGELSIEDFLSTIVRGELMGLGQQMLILGCRGVHCK